MLRSQPFAQLVFRFLRWALHIKFGQHEFLGPSSPDTFLGVPAHPGARLPGHVTDFPGLRFGTVDFDEAKRIAHLFFMVFHVSPRAASSVICLCIPISRALILKILFSSPPSS